MATRKSDPSETSVRKAVLKVLTAVPGLKVVPYPAGPWGTRGTPDLLGCYRGRMFYAEVKTLGGEIRPDQVRQMAEWDAAGAIGMVVRSADDARALVQRLRDAVE